MYSVIIFSAILLPLLIGAGNKILPFTTNRKLMRVYLEVGAIITTALVWILILHEGPEEFTLAHFTGNLTITFQMDGLSNVFAGLISLLWPLAILYSFEYMTKEENERVFFMFYTMTYGVTLGIALAGNLLTMYFFYELLTLVTVPLVMHTLSREAILASRKYLYYSLGGAAFAFIGLIFIIVYGGNHEFLYGGILDMALIGHRADLLRLIYVLAFMGFSVKAAMWPFSGWLPQAGVAPTPVTALLHAVAVVKAGAFAVIRLTYYSYGTDFLRGTWAQYVVMTFTMITIVYGCARAVKETHIKRRLAYSTVSNLSYILFAATIMTPAGLVGAISHMVFHAVMKICSFFCAGSIIHQTERTYVHELDGLGRKMPCVFGIFTVASLALMGVPGLCGFISKWNIVTAAFESGNSLAIGGVGCLLISAFLTAIYMMSIVFRAFFPKRDFDYSSLDGIKDPSWMMLLPLAIFAIAMIIMGLHSKPLTDIFIHVSQGFM